MIILLAVPTTTSEFESDSDSEIAHLVAIVTFAASKPVRRRRTRKWSAKILNLFLLAYNSHALHNDNFCLGQNIVLKSSPVFV